MRHFSTRIVTSCIVNCFGDSEEALLLPQLFLRVLDRPCVESLTPAEERAFDSLVGWIAELVVHYDEEGSVYDFDHPAFFYSDLNTGMNFLCLAAAAYEGCVGGAPVQECLQRFG